MPRRPPSVPTSFILYLMAGLIVVGLSSLLLRFQRGLLGIVLVALTAAIAIYWVKTLSRMLRRGSWSNLLCELQEEGDQISLTAQVPGPEHKVKVELVGRKLVLRGGMGFKRTVQLPFEAILKELRYVNGIVNARLMKKEASPSPAS